MDSLKVRHSEVIKLHHSIVELEDYELLQLKKHSKSAPITKLCSICCEPLKPINWIVFTCDHNQICLGCLLQYVDHAIQQKNVTKCVVNKCSGVLKWDDDQAMVIFPVGLRNRIKKSYQDKKLKNNKKCTMPDCYGFINNGTCDLCLTNFCENCYSKQHRGDCELSEFELGQNIKRCPECGEGIEKDGGCLHMTCARCKFNFCFKCRQVWSLRHHATCGTGDSSVLDWIINFFAGNN